MPLLTNWEVLVEGLGLNTVRLDGRAARWTCWRPGPYPHGPWHGRAWRLIERAGSAIHWNASGGGAIVRNVATVSALDHAWRAPVKGSRGSGAGAGLEQLTEPSSSTSGPLWGERPRIGAVCAGAVRRVL